MVIKPSLIIMAEREALLASASQMEEIRQNISQVQANVELADEALVSVCEGECMQLFQTLKKAEGTIFSSLIAAIKGLEDNMISYDNAMTRIDERATNAIKESTL